MTKEFAIFLLILLLMCMLSAEVGWQYARHLYRWEKEMIDEWRDMYFKLLRGE